MAPLDVNCLCFLEYAGIPSRNRAFVGGRDGTVVRDATLKDMEGIAGCQNTPQAFLNRFHARDYCAVAVAEGRIVGYQWFCDHPCHVEERYSYRIALPPDTIYTYDAFILPEYRLTGIWMKFHSWYLRELMQRLDKKRILTMVDHGNLLSMNTHLRFGYRPVRKVLVTKAFGKSFFLNAPLRQSVGAQRSGGITSASASQEQVE
jgi:GNAT superfamily N-acetyltransferase